MDWIQEREEAAVAKVRAELAKPMRSDEYDVGVDRFDPWELFPCFYGSYSQAFDEVALRVLRNLELAANDRYGEQLPEELAHEMFREVLCTSDLCDYGSSPRVCFATTPFRAVLPELLAKWEAYSAVSWGETA